jgi:penicillin V acylase-like amidase (Ntn superfamily)
MYEFSTIKACTGVIVRNSEGKIIHGRNLDFDMWNLFSNLVANLQYYKGDQLVYSVDTVVGSVFTLTANRPGGFSV